MPSSLYSTRRGKQNVGILNGVAAQIGVAALNGGVYTNRYPCGSLGLRLRTCRPLGCGFAVGVWTTCEGEMMDATGASERKAVSNTIRCGSMGVMSETVSTSRADSEMATWSMESFS